MINHFEKDGETYLSVNASAMLYMFVNAFQELADKNDQFTTIIEGQQKTIAQLETQLRQLTELKATLETLQAKMNILLAN